MKVIAMVCTLKKFVQDKLPILGPKMVHPHNSVSALRIFLKFCKMKNWGNLMFLAFRPFFTVWLVMVKLGLATVNWIPKQSGHDFFHDYNWILRLIWILKQWRHDFSVKHLCDGYCLDIMWNLCGGQNSWVCKASLWICYISLSEYKGPWMLKTLVNCHVWSRRL